MITGVRFRDFKSFRDAYLKVGRFTVVVGANASGKSNIRDGFRFLHGIGRGYSLADTIGGRRGPGGQQEWAPMRGAMNEIVRFGETRFVVDVDFEIEGTPGRYFLAVGHPFTPQGRFEVLQENLWQGQCEVYSGQRNASARGKLVLRGPPASRTVKTDADTPILARIVRMDDQLADIAVLPAEFKTWVRAAGDLFAGIRFVEPIPDLMREPSFSGQTTLGDHGENLSTVLQAMCADKRRKATLVEWLRELTPMDVADLAFSVDPSGRVHLMLKERDGTTVSAYSASDGTLRFLAMLATLLGEHGHRLFFLEEIDTGIHPSRLALLADLIERQTNKRGCQVITTSHSPELLNLIGDETFRHASLVYRLPGSNAAAIRPIADLPHATELRHSQGLGALHTSGWMEDVADDEVEPAHP